MPETRSDTPTSSPNRRERSSTNADKQARVARRHVCWLSDADKEFASCCTTDPGPDPTYDPDPWPLPDPFPAF